MEQSLEGWPAQDAAGQQSSRGPWSESLALYTSSKVAQGHSWLHSKFRASLGYMRSCVGEKKKKKTKDWPDGSNKHGYGTKDLSSTPGTHTVKGENQFPWA